MGTNIFNIYFTNHTIKILKYKLDDKKSNRKQNM